jgi:hypothetical protein
MICRPAALARTAAPALVCLLAACRPAPSTPLVAASAAGDVTQVARLVASGEDPNGRDSRQGWTPLFWAARNGRTRTIARLTELGADPNQGDASPNHWTPLLHAVHEGHLGAVRALLAAGANPDLGAVDGPTPLITAASGGDTLIVKALLEAGADPHRQSGAISPLSAAIGAMTNLGQFRRGECRSDTVRALLDAAPELRGQKGLVTRVGRFLLTTRGCQEVLEMLEPPRTPREYGG